jgi:cytochrome b
MTLLERLRIYHATLATLALAAYMTGELGLIHTWLGYTIAAVIVLRIVWGSFGPRQVGISRLMPRLSEIPQIRWFNHPEVSKILLSGIIINLLLTTATGIAIDQFSSFIRAPRIEVSASDASTAWRHATAAPVITEASIAKHDDERESWLGELHEATANLLLVFVVMHVGYLLLFKRKLALFMLFRTSPRE